MVSSRKTTSVEEEVVEVGKVVVEINGTMNDAGARGLLRKGDVAQVCLRVMCMVASVTALSFMVTAREASTVSIYGFQLPVNSKWSFADSFEYLVGVSAAVVAHSLLQLVINVSRLLRKSPLIPSRNHAWLTYAGDQVFAYAMMSAGSAASGVSNLNRTGIRHTLGILDAGYGKVPNAGNSGWMPMVQFDNQLVRMLLLIWLLVLGKN
ncbi:unnamed protein product [Prunus armeniaca]|uniref:CASP-like protein n=1 Tax=Prunus armeniaca TaxID=36596 RepID=A0A6J5WN80_PRUAR|nr:unnamed protein product [Prunus armeniaca]CAB4303049.1 unnamed protein product [Prunus armeniaca]